MEPSNYKTISFQGAHGAYSELACRAVFPEIETVPCLTFDAAFRAVNNRDVDLAMIPVDNTIAGRVADVHTLMPRGDLFIIGEHFQPIHHVLLGVQGATIDQIKHVHSHVHALPQCRKFLEEMGFTTHVHADTAGAAQEIAAMNDPAHAAIASSLAGDVYGLDVLQDNIADDDDNVTRFLILSREPEFPELDEDAVMTSLLFKLRNVNAALYKAMGGFATNNLNMAKLESYVGKNFQTAQFYCDIEGHPESPAFERALEELGFFATDVTLLGAYPAHPYRRRFVTGAI